MSDTPTSGEKFNHWAAGRLSALYAKKSTKIQVVGDGIQFIASSVDSKVAGSDTEDCTARVQSWSFWGPQTTGESRR